MTGAQDLSPEMAAARAKLATKFAGAVRTGGAGSARRKRVTHHAAPQYDEKKLQAQLKRLGLNQIPGIDEVNMFRENGKILHFVQPKMQASFQSHTFSVSGAANERNVEELLPGILPQLGPEAFNRLRSMAAQFANSKQDDEDEIPELVTNFEDVSQEKLHVESMDSVE